MRSSASPRAVRSRIGVVMVSRKLAVSARPSSPGIITSSTIRSNSSPSSRRRAWRGVAGAGDHEAAAGEELLQQRAEPRVVVDDEDVRLRRGAHRPASSQPSTRSRSSGSIICSSTLRKPCTASGPAVEKAARIRRRCAAESSCSSGRPARGQVQVAVAAVLDADAALDEAVVDELAQHAVQALLGDAEELEQLVDGQPGPAVDEVDRPVVGAAVLALLEDAVGVGGEAAIGEEHQLDALPELVVGQEQQLLAARRIGREAALCHRLARAVPVTVYVRHVDIPSAEC